MPNTDIGNAVASGVSSTVTDYNVTSDITDSASGDKEFEYIIERWHEFLGYYKNIPELKIAVDTKANWVLGNGYEADNNTQLVLDRIRGNGKQTFNSILESMERTCYIGEDAYAEIITNEDGLVLNLKPLDPSTIKIVFNSKGRVLRYEQINMVTPNKNFRPDQIFVLTHNRIADEVHGTSIIPAVEWVILARNEAMSDWRRVLHRNIDPLWVFHLDTDDTTKIAEFKTKMDSARGKGESMYIPKGAVVPELISTATNASLSPLAWIEQLNDYFYQAVGVPQIIVGNAKSFTDASGKIVYLAFEQRVRGRQKYVEEQILTQLNMQIELIFPASLENEALSDRPQEEPIQQPIEPNDEVAEVEGKQ